MDTHEFETLTEQVRAMPGFRIASWIVKLSGSPFDGSHRSVYKFWVVVEASNQEVKIETLEDWQSLLRTQHLEPMESTG